MRNQLFKPAVEKQISSGFNVLLHQRFGVPNYNTERRGTNLSRPAPTSAREQSRLRIARGPKQLSVLFFVTVAV